MSVRVFSGDFMDSLIDEAKDNPRRRKHKNLHAGYQEACQRFFNAIEPNSYIRPHYHAPNQGAETLIAIRGFFAFLVFSSEGEVQEIHLFGAGSYVGAGCISVGVEVQPGQWHTVISLESGSILLEVKGGPFNPEAPKYFAPWAPEEMTLEGEIYLEALKNGCIQFLGSHLKNASLR